MPTIWLLSGETGFSSSELRDWLFFVPRDDIARFNLECKMRADYGAHVAAVLLHRITILSLRNGGIKAIDLFYLHPFHHSPFSVF